jgi:hypothetical protein
MTVPMGRGRSVSTIDVVPCRRYALSPASGPAGLQDCPGMPRAGQSAVAACEQQRTLVLGRGPPAGA